MIEFFGENKDAILGIIKQLPDLLSTTGGGIAKAGESAEAASAFLLGTDAGLIEAERSELAAGCQSN